MSPHIPRSRRTTVGHPVDVSSGVVYTAWHDFEFPGFIPFVWRRFYSTSYLEPTPLGRGWMTPFFMQLTEGADGITLLDDEGQEILFPQVKEGESQANLGAEMELRRNRRHYVMYNWHHQERYVFEPGREREQWRLAWIEDLSGNRLQIDYDERGRFRSVDQAGTRLVRVEYNRQGFVSDLILMMDGVPIYLAQYHYDSEGHLVAALDRAGNAIRYEYDGAHRLVKETNRLGGSFHFEYDEEGDCTHCWGDGGYMERYLEYDKANGVTRVRDSLGHVTEYHMNDLGLVTAEVSPRGGRTETVYDESGRTTSETYPNGGTIRYEYDSRGDRVAFIDEVASEVRLTFNELHLPVKAIDPEGFEWRLEYDSRGNHISVTNPEGHAWVLKRNERGLVQTAAMPGGRRIERQFAPDLRWQESRDQVSFMERREYDIMGNEVARYDAEGLVYRADYDELGRHVAVTYADGSAVRYVWDAEGNLVEKTDVGGAVDRWEYDRFNNLIAHLDAEGNGLRIEYDTEGQLTAVVNQIGERMEYRYDEDGGIVEHTLFDGRAERYERDLNGLAIRIQRPDGRAIEQKYDPCCRVVERKTSDGSRTALTFGKRGGLVKAETNDAVVEFERDSVNRVIAEVQNGRRLEYQYDDDHNLVARRLPGTDAGELQISYDQRGRPTQISDRQRVLQIIGWDALDRLIERTLRGGVKERRRFGGDRRLAEQEISGPQGGDLIRRAYKYDGAGNVALVEDSRRGMARFEYDPLNRLVRAERPAGLSECYTYDALGTIVASHLGERQISSGARTLSDNSTRFEYGDDGHVIRVIEGTAETRYKFDADDQLAEVWGPNGQRVRYGYDAMGRRAWKEVNGKRTDFLWEHYELAAEIEKGHVTRKYCSFNMHPLAQWAEGEWFAVMSNHLSTPQELINDRGGVAWEVQLDSYGRVLKELGDTACPIRFRGQYHDRETGLYYNIHRYYNSSLAAYMSPDPIGIQGGVNFYGYSRNPIMEDDPFGLKCGACKNVNGKRVLKQGVGNKGKGDFGESIMDDHFAKKGYQKVDVPNRSQGIDGVYYNPKKGKYVIAESKYGSSRLGKTKDSKQMTDTWINGTSSPSTGGQSRLEHALQGTGHTPATVQAAGADKVLVHSDGMGNVTTAPLGTYP